jgi:ribosomal protein S19
MKNEKGKDKRKTYFVSHDSKLKNDKEFREVYLSPKMIALKLLCFY